VTDPILKAEQVIFSYGNGNWNLGPVSIELVTGQFTAIIGPNGSGKSTLLKIAAGLIKPDTGKVLLINQNLSRMNRRQIAKTAGYLPQNVTSSFDHTVHEVVAMGRYPHINAWKSLSDADNNVIEECLKMTETAEFRNRKLNHLSGGERQRVFLASVLAQEPALLLLDEPTTGLDIHHQTAFFQLLKSLAAKNITIAVVTHELNLAAMFCDHLYLLYNGKLEQAGSAEKVLQPNTLKNVYGQNLILSKHPATGTPVVLPASDSETKS
jgi:iron complex transport system ATP-binding protein